MNVAVAGLGRMGMPIARRLLQAGHDVLVYNRTASRATPLLDEGAHQAETPAGLWDARSVCVCMLSDSSALEQFALESGVLDAAPPGGVLIDMSTVSVAASRRVAEAAARHDVRFVRAPVTGNPSVVEGGNLGIMVSGPREVFDEVRPILEAIGPHLFYLGTGDEARTMKLALNLMIAGTAQLMAEALVLGEAAGLERAAMLEVMGGSAVGSPFVKYKSEALAARDYSTTFTTTLMHKDLALALATAHESGVPLPVTAAVQQLLQACISTGMGESDFIALVPRLEREAGRDV